MIELIFANHVKKFLLVLVSLHLLLLWGVVPLWVLITALFLIFWKGLHWLKGMRGPKKLEIWLMGGAGLSYIYFTRHTLLGEEAGSMVLALMAGCKLAESETYRDYSISLILCFLLLTVYLIGSQSLVSLIFLLVDVVLLVQFLFQLHPSGSSVFSFKAVFKLLGLMLPIWLLFFFVFPRFTVGFWHHQSPRSTTGFSDELNPGLVSQLAESDEIAFRVKFETPPSPNESFYWRGGVLTVTEGLKWFKSARTIPLEENVEAKPVSERYQIWLDPLYERWLFLLDYVQAQTSVKISGNVVRRKAGFVNELVRPVLARISYEAASSTAPLVHRLPLSERQVLLQLPKDLEGKVIALAQELRDPSADRSIENLTQWFRDQSFTYSLNPGAVPGGRLGGFLFQSKRGFCEHYAAASAILLRAMGFPSRVVVGFQGAEPNSIGNYWIVRNRNAHAWSEVYIETDPIKQLGYWKRVDLVSSVMPARLALGADYFQVNESTLSSSSRLSLEDLRNNAGWLARGQVKGRLLFDAAEMQWVTFLAEYDLEYQRSLLRKVGFKDTSQSVFLSFLGTLLAGWILIYSFYQRRKKTGFDPVLRVWQEFSEIFRTSGFARQAQEGPEQFIRRIESQYPKLALEIQEIGALYVSLRYEKPVQSESLPFFQFQKKVKDFKKLFRSSRNKTDPTIL